MSHFRLPDRQLGPQACRHDRARGPGNLAFRSSSALMDIKWRGSTTKQPASVRRRGQPSSLHSFGHISGATGAADAFNRVTNCQLRPVAQTDTYAP